LCFLWFLLFFVVFLFFLWVFLYFFLSSSCVLSTQYILCPTHKFCIFFFQFAGEMSNSHMYKFPQNNLYSYNMIADSLRKIHTSENREKITTKVDIPTCKLILW
jgi:competence protein ComGF